MTAGPDGAGDRPATCPSGRCREGAVLLGVVKGDGTLGYVAPALTVDADFVSRAGTGRTPESRFRFAEPCVDARCDQWGDGACGLIGQLLATRRGAALTAAAPVGLLPRCTIRRTCRWYAQEGAAACAVCPHVVHTPRAAAAADQA